MKITVRFFATLRDRAGRDSASVELEGEATIAALLKRLAEEYPPLKPALGTALVARNHEYAFPDDPLDDGDEIALFPPVSGGSDREDGWPEYSAITSDELDLDAIAATITRPETGAICLFVGKVRGLTELPDSRRRTDHLLYEAYRPMAEKKLRQVAAEIRERYPKVQGIAVVQRIGKLEVGDTTVLVGCSAGHRNDGVFEGAHYGINRLKEIVPVWKKEVGPDGSAWVEGHYRPTPQDVEPHQQMAVPDGAAAPFSVGCPECGEYTPYYAAHSLKCACGRPFEVLNTPPFDRSAIAGETFSMWRYRAMLAPPDVEPVTLGEGWTPLVPVQVNGRTVHLKLESLNPTGSFKDRGASLLASILRASGIGSVHDDSSGNAGAALAAYAARAGLSARIFVPAYASPVKRAQIALYGAQLEEVPGPRSAATRAAQQAAESGDSYYASHVYNPFSVLAYKSLAYELWEQLGHRAPDVIIAPLGHGTQILGLAEGFEDLFRAGLIERRPALIGVQARACAPLWRQYHPGAAGTGTVSEGETVAEGIRILNPVRAGQILAVIKRSKGDIIAVEEEAILGGLRELAKYGIAAEPTSAVVWPALKQIMETQPEDALIALSITGSGFKTPGLETLLQHTDNANA